MERNEMENMYSEKNTKRSNKSRYSIDQNPQSFSLRLLPSHTLRFTLITLGTLLQRRRRKEKIDCFVHTEPRAQRLTDSTC